MTEMLRKPLYHEEFLKLQSKHIEHHKGQEKLKSFQSGPSFSIITPVYNVPEPYLLKCVESTQNQIYRNFEHILVNDCSTSNETIHALHQIKKHFPNVKVVDSETNGNISKASNLGAKIAQMDYLLFLDNDDEIPSTSLADIAEAIIGSKNGPDLVYTDENKIDEDGYFCEPYQKPKWSPEHLASVMYALHPLTIKKEFFFAVGGFNSAFDGAQDHELFLRASFKTQSILHVPKVCYHWRKIPGSAAQTVDAKNYAFERSKQAIKSAYLAHGEHVTVKDGLLTGTFRTGIDLTLKQPKVSVIIPTGYRKRRIRNSDSVLLVENCIKNILEKSTYSNFELIIVDGGEENTLASQLASEQIRFVHYPAKNGDKFNFSARVNFGCSHANGEYFILLNDDTEVISNDWIEALLEVGLKKGVGAVGAKLLYETGNIQHAGIIFEKGDPKHFLYNLDGNSLGPHGFASLTRNYLAVTGACILVSRSIFFELKGFDERFAIDFNDIDFCLRLHDHGYRVAYTPYCTLYHFEQSSLVARTQDPLERSLFLDRWSEKYPKDPYHPDPSLI